MIRYFRQLTSPERLFIWRRRKGLTLRQAAQRHDVNYSQYCRWELGHEPPPFSARLEGSLKPHESCVLMRRRAKKLQREIARDLKRCRYTIYQMELGRTNPTPLLEYWNAAESSSA